MTKDRATLATGQTFKNEEDYQDYKNLVTKNNGKFFDNVVRVKKPLVDRDDKRQSFNFRKNTLYKKNKKE